VTETTGAMPLPAGATEPFGDIYSQYTMDVTTGKTWNTMTDAERAASAINVRRVSWSGLHVKLAQNKVLERGEPALRLTAGATTVTTMLGTASFGLPLTATGTTGDVVAASTPPTPPDRGATDGCSQILNDVRGRIALLDRGTCGFVEGDQRAGRRRGPCSSATTWSRFRRQASAVPTRPSRFPLAASASPTRRRFVRRLTAGSGARPPAARHVGRRRHGPMRRQ
jgi:hypothetical protein